MRLSAPRDARMNPSPSNATPGAQEIQAVYDAVPYPGGAFNSSHPDHLRVTAALAGLTATVSTTHCRVLEVGCAIGSNIIPMAQTLPRSQFLGIDLSPRQIDTGRRIVEQLGLRNIELRSQNILDFSPDEGPFDYIIAHGVYSWIPEQVRDRLMQIC